MLALSLIANIALIAALILMTRKARKRIVEEKCSTFAGCLGAITSGLAIEDVNRRFETVGRGLASLYRRTDEGEEDMNFYVTRASMLRIFRKAALADVGEHLHLLALQTAGDDDEPGSEMLEYISKAQPGEQEPRDVWGDDGLASANFVAERKALAIYRRQIAASPITILQF